MSGIVSRLWVAVAAALVCGAALAAPASAETVKMGTSGGINTAIQPILHARDAGFFKKNGLDVQIVDMADDTTSVQGLISGEYSMLYTGAGTAMIAIARGADIKMVDAFTPWTDYNFVATPEIKTLKDMEGKTMGVFKIGSLSYLAPIFALQQEGVDVNKVKIVAIGGDAARGRALATRTIDGAVINGVNAVVALKADPTLHIIYNVGALFREKAVSTAFFARGDVIRNKPQEVQEAVTALIEASRNMMSDEKIAVDQGTKSGLPAEAVQGTYDLLFKSPVPYYGIDGGLNLKAVDSTIALMKESGDIDKNNKMTAKDMVDTKFVDAAVKQLGPYTYKAKP